MPIRQPIVAVLGHIDHGKCIFPEEFVLLSDGSYVKIKDLSENCYVISLKQGYISKSRANLVKKLYNGYLYEVTLENGYKIKVTEEHPFLTEKGWKPAKYITLEDKVAAISQEKQDEIYIDRKYLKYLMLSFGYTLNDINIDEILSFSLGKTSTIPLDSWEKFINIIKRPNIKNIENFLKNDLYKDFHQIWKERLYRKIPIPDFSSIRFLPIKNIRRIRYKGIVYDLITENLNFISNNIVVHNTTLLDKIRGTAVAKKEAGGITQHIGATEIPIDTIKEICGGLLKQLKVKITIPGLLFIDTPGHEAFVNLRKRGSSLADLAILVIDILEGVMPQTVECIEILKTYKTPFVVAANKIDRIHGWKSYENYPISHSLLKQNTNTLRILEEKIYNIVFKLNEFGFNADRFDRVRDFTREIAIVPVSAITGEGIPELLMLLVGLAQRYLKRELNIDPNKPARGTILEVREEIGLGKTIDVIIYDGNIKRGDTIVLVGRDNKVIVTKVKALLKPRPLDEMRDPRYKFKPVDKVSAAAGIKIAAQNLEDAIAGMPIIVCKGDINKCIEEIRKEIEQYKIETNNVGVVLKADTIGALEAIVNMLRRRNIPIRIADVGDISRRDVIEANASKMQDPRYGVILGFNVKISKIAESEVKKYGIKVFLNNVIYRLIEEYEEWLKEYEERKKREILETVTRPAKIRILQGYVFRISKPAIVGVEVLEGTIRKNYKLFKDGKIVGKILSIQYERKPLEEAKKGERVAIAIDEGFVGRNIDENDILYTFITKEEIEILEKYKNYLREDELKVLEEIKRLLKY